MTINLKKTAPAQERTVPFQWTKKAAVLFSTTARKWGRGAGKA